MLAPPESSDFAANAIVDPSGDHDAGPWIRPLADTVIPSGVRRTTDRSPMVRTKSDPSEVGPDVVSSRMKRSIVPSGEKAMGRSRWASPGPSASVPNTHRGGSPAIAMPSLLGSVSLEIAIATCRPSDDHASGSESRTEIPQAPHSPGMVPVTVPPSL